MVLAWAEARKVPPNIYDMRQSRTLNPVPLAQFQIVIKYRAISRRQDGLLLHKQRDVAVGVHLHGQGQGRKSALIRRIQHTNKSLTGLETRT
jgi:hypothetical protein